MLSASAWLPRAPIPESVWAIEVPKGCDRNEGVMVAPWCPWRNRWKSPRFEHSRIAVSQMTDPVRDLYEALPYPERDPADESKRLLRTWLDDLPMLNHYGFAGRRAFGAGFRVLVAGGGTGDATVFLAEQLKAVGAEVVHLEVSATSLGIAKRRAEARGLANVEWVHASLLDLHSLGLGAFDYINCVGVLHHLEDPDAGVRALLGSLASGGALASWSTVRSGARGSTRCRSSSRSPPMASTSAAIAF